MARYRTAPLAIRTMPPGIPFIVANEAAERFSYYGMRAILVVYMTQYLLDSSGRPDPMSPEEAKGWFHLFVSAVYITPMLGALLADGLWGKYKTIITLSLVYCLGHFVLALDDTRTGLLIGQSLIALGAGGIKPCVSAHLGDQFGASNQPLMSRAFGWFYIAINLGAFAAMLITPYLLRHHGSSVAFAVPGVLMALATLIFWAGRYRFAHIPPGGKQFIRSVFSASGLQVLLKLSIVYLFVAMFWALFDQTGSSWVLQAEQMDRMLLGYEILPSQLQAANPLLIILLVPLFTHGLYPRVERYVTLTPMRKMAVGMFVTVLAFALAAWLQMRIDAGNTPHIAWQLLAYLILTSAEILVSITCLEFSYTQAPNAMKSFVMAFFMASVALGNLFTSAVNFFIQNPDGTTKLVGADYFWFFTLAMGITSVLFLVVVKFYRETTHIQQELPLERL
ncbi:MAG: peptide transporter [Methylothermaceae bacteria B42]|nr:MAG: peptide transporter [Methylothermaceae bacteria B42]HHJ40301.1 MFS transporter [Methylothermaceae bacterium]